MDIKREVGLRIKTIRKLRRLDQAELAERIDRTPDAVSQLERGVSLPSFETLERLSTVLEVPIRDFFGSGEEGEESSPSEARVRLKTALLHHLHKLDDGDLEVLERLAGFLAERRRS